MMLIHVSSDDQNLFATQIVDVAAKRQARSRTHSTSSASTRRAGVIARRAMPASMRRLPVSRVEKRRSRVTARAVA